MQLAPHQVAGHLGLAHAQLEQAPPDGQKELSLAEGRLEHGVGRGADGEGREVAGKLGRGEEGPAALAHGSAVGAPVKR